jgi:hypothetical protein
MVATRKDKSFACSKPFLWKTQLTGTGNKIFF